MSELSMNSNVTEVVVYPDRARLTAEAEMELETGNHRITIEKLPRIIFPESVRVSGHGIAIVQIASVDVRRSYYERTPVTRIREIEDEIQNLEDDKQVLSDEESILLAQAEYIEGLRRATVEYAKGLARGKTKIEDCGNLAAFLKEHDLELRTSMRDLAKKKRVLDERLEMLQRELQQLNSGRSKQGYQAVVELTAESEGKFTLILSYLIGKSSWRPLYDIRLSEDEGGKELDITVLAEITQDSGMDWVGVKLSVSTSRPALSQRAPELKPWYIDEPRPLPQPKARAVRAQMSSGAADVESAAAYAPMALESPTMMTEAGAKVAQRDSSGPATTFQITGRSDVPGDGSPHKTTIGSYSMPSTFDYLAVPKQVDAVYRRVKITNEMDSPLLAGKGNLFAGLEFIGSIPIEHTAPGDELELLFGTEERITVERELTLREVEKTRLRDRRELNYGYEIKVRNLQLEEVEIEIQDHFPVSRHEDIKVALERISVEPSEHSELNLLKWHLVVPPDEEKSIQYEYSVTHPRQMTVVGLVD